MKFCVRCAFQSPGDSYVCLTCGGIKFDANAPQTDNATTTGTAANWQRPHLVDAAQHAIESLADDFGQLPSKFRRACKKVLALATVDDAAAAEWSNDWSVQTQEVDMSLNTLLEETSVAAGATSFAPETSTSVAPLDEVAELKAQLEATKSWFEKCGREGRIFDMINDKNAAA